MPPEDYKRNRKKDAGILALAAAIVTILQAGASAYIHQQPSGDAEGIKALWAEVHTLASKVDSVANDVRALQEDGKQDTSRDQAIRELDGQVTAIGKAQAADEAILRAKGN